MNAGTATDTAELEPELPLPMPIQPNDEAALRAAWARVRAQLKRRSFAEAMADPMLATCIRNLAHAMREKHRGD